MTKTTIQEKAHATLGASNAKRWRNCPGSVRLIAACPPSPGNEHSRAGTAAHALMELCLTKDVDPDLYEGMTLEGVEVDAEMIEYTRPMIDYCRPFMSGGWEWKVEARFNLNPLNPPVPMYGTADFMSYDPANKWLHVVDFKSGSGVMVDAADNDQLQYYALGASLMLHVPIENVTLTIVQPRGFHEDGPIRSVDMTYAELIAFGVELMQDANATTDENAPLAAGDWCRWCPAAGACPEQKRVAVELAQIDFTAIEPLAPKPPELLSDTELAKVLAIAPMVSDWLTAARQVVERRLASGEAFPGYKLVEKRAVRKWVSESDTEQWLRAQGFETDEIAVTKLKSPAQVEKLVGKKKLPADRVTKQSSGYVMVPASDPRPEIASIAAVEFTALPAGEDE